MKVKYIGNDYLDTAFEKEKEYEVTSIEKDWYRIMTDLDEDYLFPPKLFEITDASGYEELLKRDKNREWSKNKKEEKTA